MSCCCCCFGLDDVVFPSNSPQRFVEGTLLMMIGSFLWLVFEFLERRDKDNDEVDEEEEALLQRATNKSAFVVACMVFYASVVALVLHVLSIRIIKREDERQQEDNERYTNNNNTSAREQRERKRQEGREGRTIWEWFFYPELETVPAERRMKKIRQFQTTYHHLVWSNHSRLFLMAPSVALFVMLMVRLYWGEDTFQGNFFFLDFGWKYGLLPHDRTVAENGDELYHEPAEKSAAFTKEWESYIHAVQGFASALLAFPVIYNALVRMSSDRGLWHAIVHLAPYALTIYPSYNLIKRMLKASSAFAGSSFSNNGLEWAAGFIVACALGNLLTSFTLYHRLHTMESSSSSGNATDIEQQDSNENYDDEDERFQPWWKVWHEEGNDRPGPFVRMLQTMLGLLFWVAVWIAAVMMGITWHGCLDGSPDVCVNARQDGSTRTRADAGQFATFLIIPVVVLLGTLVMRCRSKRNR